MPESFFEPDGEAYVATEATRGPWDPGAQHAGPPAALIGREIERLGEGRTGGGEGPPAQVGRITYEILRLVPIARLRVEPEIVRPGRRVELVGATLFDDDGEPLVRSQAWRLRTEEVDFETPTGFPPAPPGPEGASPGTFPDTGFEVGYHTAMEYRFVQGDFTRLGPATVWMRMGLPLLPDEEPTPAATGPDRRGLRQRRQRRARLEPLPLHQRRPECAPPSDAHGGLDLPGRGHPA